jgi:zinc/manganese transport system ATP-binding protein
VTAISCENVTIALGGRVVLSSIDFAIGEGEFIGMLGANGSGKTTLIRTILGLIPVQAGAISVLGGPARRGNPAIGYMPQARGALGAVRLSGWEWVASAAAGARWGLPRLNAQERRDVDWALDMVDARDLARRPLSEISGGERQRLLLSQALLGRPKLLLLDEPLVNLDPTRQGGVIELVKRLQKELGLAVLFSAHELNPLLPAMDRVLYLGGGKAALGTVDEIVNGPVLSRLYGSDIEVVRLSGRIFVMAGAVDLEQDAHRHDHDHDHRHYDAGSENVRL